MLIHNLIVILMTNNKLHAINAHDLLVISGGGFSCESWLLGVETNNVRGWKTVPRGCESFVGQYMIGKRYGEDLAMVVGEAEKYARGLKLGGDGKEVWVFDVDDTALSNLPFYAHRGFGARAYNKSEFDVWVNKSRRPAVQQSLRLYKTLLSLGIKVMFLGTDFEHDRDIISANLRKVGYITWEKLLLRIPKVKLSTISFKSSERKKLQQEGYKIVGNIGDQWSDILGTPEGDRTFKLPNPMYYVN
ncbi:acid phosphatase 1-like isoform X1 [Dioscorea cayenensis subsp. rotundata]|uniref:Acid phosphatase 1-like isoform X1 n=1 Tax=Dioscorea cayennensis subsp. rotundata TaxID=55577 RepID=A0AB40CXA8_DIOCR|nr:acid phosphatase 1-like isoform X1 [Dioscorea cayenensis subsp. rotundata]